MDFDDRFHKNSPEIQDLRRVQGLDRKNKENDANTG